MHRLYTINFDFRCVKNLQLPYKTATIHKQLMSRNDKISHVNTDLLLISVVDFCC